MSIFKAVLKLVRFSEERLEEKYTWDRRHKMRIFDQDPGIREEYRMASERLNDRGMLKFKESVQKMRNKEGLLSVHVMEDGEERVQEVFRGKPKVGDGNDEKKDGMIEEDYESDLADEILFIEDDIDGEEAEMDRNFNLKKGDEKESLKIYETSIDRCNCAWHYRSRAPCRHILFLRKRNDLCLFDSSLFSFYFSKDRNLDLELKEEQEKTEVTDNSEHEVTDNSEHVLEDDNSEDEGNSKTLTREQKYKLVGPSCERLVDAMIRCGTKKVEQYHDELNICIGNVKNGRSLFNVPEKEKGPIVLKVMDKVNEKFEKVDEEYKPRKKYDLDFHDSTKVAKIGRPRTSKVKFKKKDVKNKKKYVKEKKKDVKEEQTDANVEQKDVNENRKDASLKKNAFPTVSEHRPEATQIICSFPPNQANPRQYAVFEGDYQCLDPRNFISTNITDFKQRLLQPEGPAGQAVWLLSSELAQQMTGRWWEAPELCRQLEKAKLYEDEGCKIVFMPWCEKGHFFSVVAVPGPQDRMYIMESIGGYDTPAGAALLGNFLRNIRARKGWDPVDCITKTLESPKQPPGSNNCGLFMLENAAMILRDPDDFCLKAETGSMKDWYPSSQVEGRREEMAGLIRRMGNDQREPGQVHETQEALNLQDFKVKDFKKYMKVKVDKKIAKQMVDSTKGKRKCGL